MKYREIIFKEESEKLYSKFIEIMAKETDSKIIEFLFENPLYRSTRPSPDWTKDFGINPIRKNRNPLSTNPYVQFLIDQYLESKGFRALRSNSIFATHSKEQAKFYLYDTGTRKKAKKDIFVIFPEKKFYFTWNLISEDFYVDVMYIQKNFDFNIENILQKGKNLFENFIEKIFNEILSKISTLKDCPCYEEYNEIPNLIKERQYIKVIKILKNIFFELSKKNQFQYDIIVLSSIEILGKMVSLKDLKDIFTIKEDSPLIQSFTNKDFFQAVKSNHEIMITNDIYFYISDSYFSKNKDKILSDLRDLKKHW